MNYKINIAVSCYGGMTMRKERFDSNLNEFNL